MARDEEDFIEQEPEKKDDDDIYSENVREDLLEGDEISAVEEGFMEGAHDDGQNAKCRKCGKPLSDDFIERRGKNKELLRFCSDECCEEYFEKQ